mmetsp:Transcript_4621/g.10633  ORF Transcript_4621/g.10633 Transcript_4621/m.10633 type:complete len:160 (-) Transcript_4621:396-875(-)
MTADAREKRDPELTPSSSSFFVIDVDDFGTADMARLIGTKLAIDPTSDGRSRQVTWSEVEEADPDVVVVACCGFDLQRNLDDARSSGQHFAKLRSNREGNLYAANGDQYFARPSPKLLTGAVIMALGVYNEKEEPDVFRAIKDLSFSAKAFDSLRVMKY